METLGSYLTAFFGPTAQVKNSKVKLIYRKAEIPLSLIGDLPRIRQVTNNLMSNAVKFTESGTIKLIIDYTAINDNEIELLISICDDGIGIEKQQLATIFQPFSQADGSISRKYGGTGLGLTISKKIAKLLGGDISVSSTLNEGSTFIFSCRCQIDHAREKQRLELVAKLNGMSLQIINGREYIQIALSKFFKQYHVNVTDYETLQDLIDQKYHTNMLITDIDAITTISEQSLSELIQAADKIIIIIGSDQENIALPRNTNNVEFFHSPFSIFDMVDFFVNSDQSKSLPNSQENNIDFSSLDILCAEDNLVNMQVIKGMLKKINVKASFVVNGEEAVSHYKASPCNIILMDCEMPEMDGLAATRVIRRWEKEKNITPAIIIALTAHAFSEAKERCFQAGMNDVMTKPLLLKDLRVKLEECFTQISHKN